MKKKLSILICTLEARHVLLKRLMHRLNPQLNDQVEVLIESDNGKRSIGNKRNMLLKKATGDYVSFIDDDDLVSYGYVRRIFEALKSEPDCCGITGIVTFSNKKPRIFMHSRKNRRWYFKDNIYYRPPNHINPIRRKIALKIGFPDVNRGEDRDFSSKVFKLLKSEKYIEPPIYFYLHGGARVKMKFAQLIGDFSYKVEMTITEIKGSACGIEVNNSVFGFQGRKGNKTFLEGYFFRKVKFEVPTDTLIEEGKRFLLKIKRVGEEITFFIDKQKLFFVRNYKKDIVSIVLRPMRANMEVHSITIKGKNNS